MAYEKKNTAPISNSLSTDDQEGRTTVGAILFGSASNNNNLNDDSMITNKLTNNDFDDMINGFYNDNEIELESSFHIDLPYLERFNRALFQRPGSRALSVPSYFPFASINHYAASNLFKSNQNDKKNRTATSKSNKSSLKFF